MNQNRKRPARHTAFGITISIVQVMSTRLVRGILLCSGGIELKNEFTHIDKNAVYIFAANHQSRIDPFAVFAAMSFTQNRMIAPAKFMTARSIYYSFLRPLLYLHGCFPTKTKHINGVETSINAIRDGYSVCIFPEGRRTLRSESSPKDGICRIIEGVPEARLILIHLEWTRVGRFKRHVKVVMRPATSLEQGSDQNAIMNAIYDL